MLSKPPLFLNRVSPRNLDNQILRASIIAELDAINLYEQFAEATSDPILQAALLDVAREEKTHVGEFQALLLSKDDEQVEELERGEKEAEEIIKRYQARIRHKILEME
ncbi:MAG: ferritin family protein [Candidatus Thermoplasmatota archaeon]|nr:ferritin family protein [Candidatus Thermoplasmatota archaeon]